MEACSASSCPVLRAHIRLVRVLYAFCLGVAGSLAPSSCALRSRCIRSTGLVRTPAPLALCATRSSLKYGGHGVKGPDQRRWNMGKAAEEKGALGTAESGPLHWVACSRCAEPGSRLPAALCWPRTIMHAPPGPCRPPTPLFGQGVGSGCPTEAANALPSPARRLPPPPQMRQVAAGARERRRGAQGRRPLVRAQLALGVQAPPGRAGGGGERCAASNCAPQARGRRRARPRAARGSIVALLLAPRLGRRYCEMNVGSIYNDCDVPQELTDQQIDQIHEQVRAAGAALRCGSPGRGAAAASGASAWTVSAGSARKKLQGVFE